MSENKKLYRSIGEVAQIIGENASLIRFWEKEFPVFIKPKKNRKGNRLFTEKDIENIKYIYFLVKEKEYTLAGAKKVLKNKKIESEKSYKTIEDLQKVKDFLINLKSKM